MCGRLPFEYWTGLHEALVWVNPNCIEATAACGFVIVLVKHWKYAWAVSTWSADFAVFGNGHKQSLWISVAEMFVREVTSLVVSRERTFARCRV